MKTCPRCRRVNNDEAKNCHACGTELGIWEKSTVQDQNIPKSDDESFPPWVKWGLYFAAWGVLILATLANKPCDLRAAPGFPIGLLSILPKEESILVAWWAGPIAILGGWMIYVVLTVMMGLAERAGVFSLIYISFCVLLALNLAGCKTMLETAAGIH